MAVEGQNYTLGRGKVYLSRFKPGTQVPEGFRYIGNTPEFSLTIESENLDHFSSDAGIREKDDSVPLEVSRTGTLTTDSIQPENVALFYFGTSETLSQSAVGIGSEEIEGVLQGHSYWLGVSALNPTGYRGLNPNTIGVASAGAVAADGELTFSGTGTDGDTVTIGTRVYTLRATPSQANEVDIGVDAATTAANLVAAINAGAGAGTLYGTGTAAHSLVWASAVGAVVTVTAKTPGTGGNSIATTESGTGTSFASATLLGGTGTGYEAVTDYVVNPATGQVDIVSGGGIADGTDIDVTFSVLASTRERVISGSEPVEGALRFIADNPKGEDFDYYLPYVKITPNGDYALKGDEWQQIPFSLEALKPADGREAIYVDGRPLTA
jgi:hypothetical protein